MTQPTSTEADRKSPAGLWYPGIHLRSQDEALLCCRFVARAHEDGGRRAAIYRDVQHVCRDIDVVARSDLIAVFEFVAGPQLKHVAAHHVERRLVMLVHVRLG